MASVLRKAGFSHVESLREFSNRYPEIPILLDETLSRIWISHLNEAEIPSGSEGDPCNYFQLYMMAKEKADEVKAFGDVSQFDFDVYSLSDKIYKHFGGSLSKYIFSKCHIFYNWGINAFEPVINVVEVQKKLEKFYKRTAKENNKNKTFSKKKFAKTGNVNKRYSPALQKKLILNSLRIRKINQNPKGVGKSAKDVSDPAQERFTLSKILYSVPQLTKWPKNHILQKNSVEELLRYIINVKVEAPVDLKNYLAEDLGNWMELRKIFGKFLTEHSAIEKNNGYGRILEAHLKKLKDNPSEKKLSIIPKAAVISYVFDILRRVLPIDFFGKNICRKKIFSRLSKILAGSKSATFTWEPLVNDFRPYKNDIKWCQEVRDDFTSDRLILKIFKWIVKEYIFVILRSYFFVSETNASDYELNFYRKSDAESVSFFALNDLLYFKKLKKCKSSDSDYFTLERKWIDTGEIEEKDLDVKCKKFMSKNTEHVQPIANVRFLPKNAQSSDVRLITNLGRKVTKNLGKNDKRKRLLKAFVKRQSYRTSMVKKVKLFLEFLADKVKTGIEPWPNNPELEIAWSKCYYLRKNYGKLYFVKADISDAFGSVSHPKLKEILQHITTETCGDFLQLKTVQEWKHAKSNIRLKTRAAFSKRPTENSVLTSRRDYEGKLKNGGKFLSGEFLKIIYQIVFRQRLLIKNKIYFLREGLAQGGAGKFSTLLNEIYYSWMDKIFFGEFLKSDDVIFLRGVDDYLFVSPDLEKAKKFFDFVYNGISECNAKFSRQKLLTNIHEEDLKIIPYIGLSFNVEDMSVSPNFSKHEGKNLISTMKLFDKSGDIHFKKFKFLERRAKLINSLKLYPILFNKFFNDSARCRRIIFDACCMQANRILVLVKYLFDDEEINSCKLHGIIFKSLKKITVTILRVNKNISRQEIKWLFSHAMLAIFARCSGKFGDLIALIKRDYILSENYFSGNGKETVLEDLKRDIDFFSKKRGVSDLFWNLSKLK